MRNAPDTWMPLVIGSYLADTRSLSTEGHGAYLLILMAYWSNGGPLPDDDDEFAAITGLGAAGWEKWRPKLARFFTIEGGYWRQKRADQELADAKKRQEAFRLRSAKANAAKVSNKDTLKDTNKDALKEADEVSLEAPSKSKPTSNEVLAQKASPSSPRARLGRDPIGTRLPDDWGLSDELFDWSVSEARAPPDRIEAEVPRFRDYWRSKPGKDGRKSDWDATWRNWLRKAMENGHGGRNGGGQQRRSYLDGVREFARTAGTGSDHLAEDGLPG